jgi:hypothetical protein
MQLSARSKLFDYILKFCSQDYLKRFFCFSNEAAASSATVPRSVKQDWLIKNTTLQFKRGLGLPRKLSRTASGLLIRILKMLRQITLFFSQIRDF